MMASDPASPSPHGRRLRSIAGRDIYFDNDGFFWDVEDWSREVAQELAKEMGMAGLCESCWQVLSFMREYYFYHGRAPLNKDLRKGTKMSILEIEALFPAGVRMGARLLAGLPNPKTCY